MGATPVVSTQRWPRNLTAVEFALSCGALHFAFAGVTFVLALAAAERDGQAAFFTFVGYFTAFSIWVMVRALLFVRYLGVRPPRGGASAGLLLIADVVVLVVSLPGVALVGWIALPVAMFLVFLAIPTAVTWWAVQPLSPPGSPNGSFGVGRGLLWSMALIILFVAGTALLFAAFVALSPSGP